MDAEQWRPIERWPGYEVNDDGVDYIGPAIEDLEVARNQPHLFGQASAPDSLGEQHALFA